MQLNRPDFASAAKNDKWRSLGAINRTFKAVKEGEFIVNRQVLRQLIEVMLTTQDWEMIAAVAADALQQQIRHCCGAV